MPENTTDVLDTIIAIVAEEAGADPATVSGQSRFAEDLDIDSLGLLTVATQVEEQCGVTIDDAVIPTLTTVNELLAVVTGSDKG